MLTLFSFFFFCYFLFGFSSFIYFYRIFLSLGVWDPKLMNLKLGERSQFWPVFPSEGILDYLHLWHTKFFMIDFYGQ